MEIRDFGPIYKETDLSGFMAEPFSVFSNLIFLFVVVFWYSKIWHNWRQHKFLVYVLPILFIGFVGGSLYHATRSSKVWLFMDFLPIGILVIAAGIYFWRKLIKNWLAIVLIVILPTVIFRSLAAVLISSEQVSITIGYFILSLTIILPLVIYIFKTKNKRWPLFVYSLASFILALIFRGIDLSVGLSMGTHWLWHLFGGIATYFIVAFIYYDKEDILRKRKK